MIHTTDTVSSRDQRTITHVVRVCDNWSEVCGHLMNSSSPVLKLSAAGVPSALPLGIREPTYLLWACCARFLCNFLYRNSDTALPCTLAISAWLNCVAGCRTARDRNEQTTD
jgi:hypothetical protein